LFGVNKEKAISLEKGRKEETRKSSEEELKK
jgi:hypothetical protein